MFSGLVQAFAWVTIVFAADGALRAGEALWRNAEWKPSDLPPVPVQQATIKKSEPIAGIIFSVLWLILITTAPYLIAAYVRGGGRQRPASTAGHSPSCRCSTLTVLTQMMPLVVVIICIGIVKEVLRLAEGRYTVRLAIATTVLNAAVAHPVHLGVRRLRDMEPELHCDDQPGVGHADSTAAYVWSISSPRYSLASRCSATSWTASPHSPVRCVTRKQRQYSQKDVLDGRKRFTNMV